MNVELAPPTATAIDFEIQSFFFPPPKNCWSRGVPISIIDFAKEDRLREVRGRTLGDPTRHLEQEVDPTSWRDRRLRVAFSNDFCRFGGLTWLTNLTPQSALLDLATRSTSISTSFRATWLDLAAQVTYPEAISADLCLLSGFRTISCRVSEGLFRSSAVVLGLDSPPYGSAKNRENLLENQ